MHAMVSASMPSYRILLSTLFLAAVASCSGDDAALESYCVDATPETRVFTEIVARAPASYCNETGHREISFGNMLEFAYIPAGTFVMGSAEGLADQTPAHEVYLDGYWIAKYPVTVAQFAEFIEETAYITDAERGWGSWQWTGQKSESGDESDVWYPMADGRWNNIYFEQGGDHPVGSVSWNDANAFAAWLSDKTQVSIVLPTEAQWEKAARGADQRLFPWGNARPDGHLANLADNRFIAKYGPYTRHPDAELDDGFVETSPVNAFPEGQSPYGVYDMAGNLGEWVLDVYDADYYNNTPAKNPGGPAAPAGMPDQNIERVNRGGSWVDWAGVEQDGTVSPGGGHNLLAAARTGDEQNSSDDHMGFRVAIDMTRTAVEKLADPNLPDLGGVTIVTHKISDRIYMLEATRDTAGNIGVLVGRDGLLIVDDQFAELSPQIEAALRQISDTKLRYILNTHHHADHSDGNSRLASDSQATIVAHDQTRYRLLSKGPANWPDITFDDKMSIHFGGEHVRMISIPGGHTDNDVVVQFESSNVVHLGDLMNSGISSFPVADLSSGGNALTFLDNVEELLSIVPDGATIIPGHGPLTDKSELYRLHAMLMDTIETVKVKKQAGKSLEQIQAEGLPSQYADWGQGYMNADGWIAMIHESIESKDAM